MTDHYGDDSYTDVPTDVDDMSLDTSFDDAGSEPLWETDGSDIQTLDAVTEDTGTDPALDVPPAPDLPDYTDPTTLPEAGDLPTDLPVDLPTDLPTDLPLDGPDLSDQAQSDLNPDGSPVTPPEWAQNPGQADPWVQDQVDYAAETGEDPYAGTDTDDPYADTGDTAVEDPYATGADDPYADAGDTAVEDPYGPGSDDAYDGPSDLPVGYDPSDYSPVEYPYDSPFEDPGYDSGYDPYAENPAYDPYADGAPYGGGFDVVYDPCFGDVGYDPYHGVFVEVNVTIEGDVYVVGDESADVYTVNEGDNYTDNSTTIVDDSSYSDNSTTVVDQSDTTAVDPSDTYGGDDYTNYDGYDADSVAPYESYGPMEVSLYTPDWSPADFDGVGDPLGDAGYYHEVENPVNAPLATEGQIIEKLTGEPYNEAAFAAQAENAGFFDPELGMTNTDVGSLLELHGIETETVYDADVNTLIDSLENGDPVMAVVDLNETGAPLHDVVTGEPIEQNPSVMGSVWVTGMDVQPDGSVYVLVNDPGLPEGQTQAIALEDFTNAWYDGGNQAVIAHQPV